MRPSDEAFAQDPGESMPADRHTVKGGPGRSRPLIGWQGVAVALLAGAIAIGGCEGDNLWSADSESLQPRITGIYAPAQVFAGDTIQVQVGAYGPRLITSVAIQLAGAVTRDTTLTMAPPAASVVATLKVALPTFHGDTLLIIRAIAYDRTGASSRIYSDTSTAVASLAVVDLAGPRSVRPAAAAGRIAIIDVRPRDIHMP